MKISVIMIDGAFRENVFGSKYFLEQDFPADQYEVIWVESTSTANEQLAQYDRLDVITLNREEHEYHSSYCFNAGIKRAKGELLVIPDADQIVRPDFLSTVWNAHQEYNKLACYIYRYDEIEQGSLETLEFSELENKCKLKNTTNYGGCLTVRKKWLMAINGYEEHKILSGSFHANGLDVYTRLKNIGLAIQWHSDLKLFHPWHPFTLLSTSEYDVQRRFIDWRKNNLQSLAFNGIDPAKNTMAAEDLDFIAEISALILHRNNEKKKEKLLLERLQNNARAIHRKIGTILLPSKYHTK